MRFLFLAIFFAMGADANQATFTWDDPADPSIVEETRLYRVGPTDIDDVVGVVQMPGNTIDIDVPDGANCYYATHANSEYESDQSNEVCLSIPSAPANLKIEITITLN